MPLPTFDTSRPFTVREAARRGLSPHRLRRMVRTGEVRVVLHGVYVASHVADSLDLRARAAALVLPPRTVVADRSAAWLHGVDVLTAGELDAVPRLEVVTYGGGDRSRSTTLYAGERDLLEDEVTLVDGVPATTPLRTACDIACLRGRWRAIGALDAFRRTHAISEHQLRAMLPRYAGRRGVVQLRELVGLSTAEAHSQPESWIRLALHDHGLPMPRPQVRVPLPGGGFKLVENAWPRLRLAAEYDGEEFHSEDDDREHDAVRRNLLTDELDWMIFVLRREALKPERHDVWLRDISDAFHLRAGTPHRRVYARDPSSYLWRPRRR